MGRMEKSVEIGAPPEKVWEMLALDRWSEWQPGSGFASLQIENGVEFTSEVNTPEDKYRVGATARPTTYDKLTFKVTESLENERITYLIEEPGRESTITCILEPLEVGTKFTYAVEYEMPWGIFGKFLEKLYLGLGLGEKTLEKLLGNLKSILEN